MAHHDDDDCPYFWMWLLDGLPIPILVIILIVIGVVWLFQRTA